MHSDTNLKCTLQIWVHFNNPVQHITSYNSWNVVYIRYWIGSVNRQAFGWGFNLMN